MIYQIINEKEALSRIFDKDLLKELLGDFSQMKELNWEEFDKLLDSHDTDAMEMISHTIKGVSGNLSLTGIYHAATALNDIIKQGDSSMISSSYDLLKREVARFTEFLPRYLAD